MSSSTSTKPLKVVHTSSEEETVAVARSLGGLLKGGDWLALVGDLGGGKTVFVKGVAQSLGIRGTPTSPTFALSQVHLPKPGHKLSLRHVDLYRLASCDVPCLGWEELSAEDGVTLVEWADKARGLWPDQTIEIRFSVDGENRRTLAFYGAGRAQEIVRKVVSPS